MARPVSWCVMLWLLAAPVRGEDWAARTLEILVQRCGDCHGTQMEKPKGKFGYVNDLARLAGDRELVEPGDADASGLWQVIEFGDMPPEDTKHGMLTEVEKQTIRRWITEGAKVGSDSPVQASTTVGKSAGFSVGRLVSYVGRFHPLAVHFPIALVFGAMLAELLRKRHAAGVCLGLGAIGAIAATALGWALWWKTPVIGEHATYMLLHQWVGTTTTAWVVMTWAISPRKEGDRHRRSVYLVALAMGCVGIGWVGHWGGLLVWGVDYFSW